MATKKNNRFAGAIILHDDRDFDSKGNPVDLMIEDDDNEMEVEEPYDPAYLEDAEPEVYKLKPSERAYYNRISRIKKFLAHDHVGYEWLENEMFLIQKESESGYPHVRYLYVDGPWYCFSTYEDIVFYTTSISEFRSYIRGWINK